MILKTLKESEKKKKNQKHLSSSCKSDLGGGAH